MQLDEKEQKLGAIWFLVVGPIGFVVILFLARVDHYLTYTDSEQRHAEVMTEIRLAQTSLTVRTLDDRNAGERAYRESAGVSTPDHASADHEAPEAIH
jgi:hypothetical protein